MSTVPRISTALATVLIETLFYGIYVVLFVTSIYLLFTLQSRGLRRERSVWLSPILLGGSVLFVTVTGHWTLSIDRLFLAFVIVDNGSNPVEFYGDYSQPTQVLQSSLLLVSLAVVDGLFVHRLWTVWSHNRYVMILPCLTMLGLIISTIGGMYAFSQFKLGDSVDALANGWIIAESLFTVFTNMYCTVFISWRLWRVQNILKPAGGRSLNSVIVIIVESAALSTAWAFFFIAAYAVRSNLRFLIDVTPAVVGTANMLIYVRVGLGWTKTPAPATPVTAIRFNIASSPHLSEYGEEVGKKQVGLVCASHPVTFENSPISLSLLSWKPGWRVRLDVILPRFQAHFRPCLNTAVNSSESLGPQEEVFELRSSEDDRKHLRYNCRYYSGR